MILKNVNKWVVLAGVVKKLICGGVTLWQIADTIKNLLPTATDTDRKTVFNGIGYVSGKRLSSSSGAVSSSVASMCASGFIPAAVGDTVYIKGLKPVAGVAAYFITYNSANTKVAHKGFQQKNDGSAWSNANAVGYTYDEENNILVVSLTSANFGTGFDAFRFSGHMDENTIVTVNKEL